MKRMLGARLKGLVCLIAQSVSASFNSTGVDTQGYQALMLLVSTGAFAFSGTNKIALKLQESSDNATWTDVGVDDMKSGDGTVAAEGASVLKTLQAAGDGSAVIALHYRGVKRYVRVVGTVSGTVTAPMSIVAVGGQAHAMPS